MDEAQRKIEKEIEDLFGEEPLGPVEEELFKWMLFSYSERGCGINGLDRLDFELFKDKLMKLVEAVYQRYLVQAAGGKS